MNSVASSIATPLLSPQSWRPSPPPTRLRFGSAFASKRVGRRRRPPRFAARLQALQLAEPFRGSKCGGGGEEAALVPEEASESLGRVIQCAVKPLACTVFFIAVGFAPFRRVQAPAAAAAAAAELNLERVEEGSEAKGHEFSKRLLEKVSVVLRCMDG
ncbi:hypothetical protein ACJRO7_020170 [Eucalyptus globulus]|uniref:Uncharacterized protein n=1 Tax=Eucalyptus globulus TaxID=34317 RepID=A0ABD3KFP2_EUCGL